MRETIRDLLLQHPDINNNVDEFYTYRVPETAAMQKGILIYIDPLDIPMPTTYMDGESYENKYLYQIDVFAPISQRPQWETVHEAVKDVMTDKNGLRWSLTGGDDQFDNELKVYRYMQRFTGKYKN